MFWIRKSLFYRSKWLSQLCIPYAQNTQGVCSFSFDVIISTFPSYINLQWFSLVIFSEETETFLFCLRTFNIIIYTEPFILSLCALFAETQNWALQWLIGVKQQHHHYLSVFRLEKVLFCSFPLAVLSCFSTCFSGDVYYFYTNLRDLHVW